MTPEFSSPIRLDTIGIEPRAINLKAKDTERDALAKRFALVALDMLTAQIEIAALGAEVDVRGRFTAKLAQSCVVTGAAVPVSLDEPFHIRFSPPIDAKPDEEIELADDECDTIEHDGQVIDVGEAVAQSLALALDPYPRSAEADAAAAAAGLLSEEDVGPFAVLKGLKAKLDKGGD